MPRVNYIKKAQQRYKTVPVLDADGNPTYRILQRARPTKRGETEIRQRVTVADKSQPLPPLRCDYPACSTHEIVPGQAYKWIKPKSGPYGGHQRNRHADHPSWHPWEYSSSLSARIAQIQHDAAEALNQNFESKEDVESALSDIAEEIRALAEEKREAASNIEDGFGHATTQSEELEQTADDLDTWADDVENAEIPDYPTKADLDEFDWDDCSKCSGDGLRDVGCADCQGTGVINSLEGDESDCNTCGGDGTVEEECDECDGTGKIKPSEDEEPTEEQIGDWQSEVEDATTIVDESPV